MARKRGTAAELGARLRLDGFRFWRDVGGPLEARPGEPLRLAGIWHLLGYFRYVWPAAIGLVASIFLSAAIGVLPAFTVRHIINVDLRAHTAAPLYTDIRHLALLFVLLGAIHALYGWLSAWSTSRIVWRLRTDVLGRQQELPLGELVERGSGTTMVRAINEVGVAGGDSPVFSGVAGVITTTTTSMNNIVTLISSVVAMFVLNARLAPWAFVFLPLPVGIALWWGRIIYGAVRRQYERLTTLTDFVLHAAQPLAVLRDRVLGRRQAVAAAFSRKNRELTNASIYARVLYHWYDNLFGMMLGGTTALLWFIGGHRVLAGSLTIGTLVAMISLVARAETPVHNLAEIWFSLRSLAAVADRVSRDLEGTKPPAAGHAPSPTPGEPPYRVVSLTQADPEGRPRVADLDFTLAAGRTMTILLTDSSDEDAVWRLAGALTGWLSPQAGRVESGGVNLASLTPTQRRAAVALVTPCSPGPDQRVRDLLAEPVTGLAGFAPAWRALFGDDVPAPDPDSTCALLDPTDRFRCALVAARLAGAPVWCTVYEPAGIAGRWSDPQAAIVRLQPMAGTGERDEEALVCAAGEAAAPLPPGQRVAVEPPAYGDEAGQTNPESELAMDPGRGLWAALGLRSHATARTARFWQPFRYLFAYVCRYWVYWLVVLVFGEAISTLSHTFSPLITRQIVDTGIARHQAAILNHAVLLLVLLAVGTGLSTMAFTSTFIQAAGKRMCGELRQDFFRRLLEQPPAFFRGHAASEVTSRVINDVNAIFTGTDAVIKVVTWMVIPNLPGMVLLWTMAPRFGLLTLIIVAPFVAVTIWSGRLNARLQERIFGLVGALATAMRTRSRLPQALLVRASGRGVSGEDVAGRLNDALYRLGLVQSLRGNWFGTVEALEGNALTLAFWGVGGLAILHGQLLLGTLIALMAFGQRYVSLGGGVSSYVAIHGVLANVDRISAYEPQESPPPPSRPPASDLASLRGLPPGSVCLLATAPGGPAATRDALLESGDLGWLTPELPLAGLDAGDLAGREGLVRAAAAFHLELPPPGTPATALHSPHHGTWPVAAALAVATQPALLLLDLSAPAVPPWPDGYLADLRQALPQAVVGVLASADDPRLAELAELGPLRRAPGAS